MLNKIIIFLILCLSFATCSFALSAQSAVLIDGHTGRVLMEQNGYQKRGMASTTKIMTAIVAIENGNLADVVTVSYKAANVEGSSMWLKSGEKISLESLLYGLMLNSGNDAATAIAEHIGGDIDGFAKMMNDTAYKLGLSNTSFTNPHGLDNENHYTTAYDLAQLTKYALKNPTFAKIVSTKSKTVENGENTWGRSLKNHNKMLSIYDNADGVKTGFTKKCGRCLVTSATRDNLKLIAVTLKASNDWNDHEEMLNFGFSKYQYVKLLNANDYIKTIPVNNGSCDSISSVCSKNIELALTDDEIKRIKINYNLPENINAPILINQKIGTIDVVLDNVILSTTDVISSFGVAKKVHINFFDKLKYLILELLSNFSIPF